MMAQLQNGNLDYMDNDDFDIAEFDEDHFEGENQSQNFEYSDSEDDNVNMVMCDEILISMTKFASGSIMTLVLVSSEQAEYGYFCS